MPSELRSDYVYETRRSATIRIPVGLLRLLSSVSLASFASAIPTIAVALFNERTPSKRDLVVVTFIFGASWLLWLLAALATALRMRHGPIRRIAFQIAGALLAFIHPLIAMISVLNFVPLLIPGSGRHVETPVLACLEAGLGQIPFGLLGAWILWRVAFPSLAAAFAGDMKPSSRRWEHLQRTRLYIFMPLAPTPAAIAMAAVFVVSLYSGPFSELPPDLLRAAPGWIFVIAASLMTLGGMIFVGATSQLQRYITRGNCLFFGATISFLLPCTWAIISAASRHLLATDPTAIDAFVSGSFVTDVAFLSVVGTMLVPFGLLGGWLLWQAGVAPSPNPATMTGEELAFD